jgi:hypothetical protein
MLELKRDVFRECSEKVGQRIASLEAELRTLSESASSDTKSSMGDKYETAREMMNLEKEKYSTQLEDAEKMKTILNSLKIEHSSEKVVLGSLVKSSTCLFFVSISLGKIPVNGKEVFVISTLSPIGQSLMGKQVNNSIEFAGKVERIIAIA